MEKYRSVIRIGNSTFSVSLPKDWVNSNNIQRGQQLIVNENPDGSLSIHSKSRRKKTMARVDADLEPEMVLRNVIGAYVSGAHTIEIQGTHAAEVSERARSRLSGIEIEDESSDGLSLQIFESTDEIDISRIFNRLYSISSGMMALARSGLEAGTDVSAEISRRDDEVDRLYLLFLRKMNGPGAGTGSILDVLAAKLIERIADNIEILGKSRADAQSKKALLSFSLTAAKGYRMAFEAFIRRKCGEADFRFVQEYLDGLRAEKNVKRSQDANLITSMHSLEKIGEYSEDLLEICIDQYRTAEISEPESPVLKKK